MTQSCSNQKKIHKFKIESEQHNIKLGTSVRNTLLTGSCRYFNVSANFYIQTTRSLLVMHAVFIQSFHQVLLQEAVKWSIYAVYLRSFKLALYKAFMRNLNLVMCMVCDKH